MLHSSLLTAKSVNLVVASDGFQKPSEFSIVITLITEVLFELISTAV